MNLVAFTISLDSMPFITWHLPNLNRLSIPFRWIIAEGAAQNVKDTGWCNPQSPRLSRDGTTEYLNSIRSHPRVTVLQRQMWNGKVEQCNACLAEIKESCVLLEVDSDEVWSTDQLEKLVRFFEGNPSIKSARFFCRMFVGQNIIITSTHAWGNRPTEWLRAWRFEPGMKFVAHEPPIMNTVIEPCATREQTREIGLVFEHYSYVFERTVEYKTKWYNYSNGLNHWRRLQANTVWPVTDLRQFLPWVDPGVTADLLFK